MGRKKKVIAEKKNENESSYIPEANQKILFLEKYTHAGYEVENISGVLMFHGDHEINDIKIMLHKDGYRGSYGVTKKKFHKNVAPENNGISDVNKEEE